MFLLNDKVKVTDSNEDMFNKTGEIVSIYENSETAEVWFESENTSYSYNFEQLEMEEWGDI